MASLPAYLRGAYNRSLPTSKRMCVIVVFESASESPVLAVLTKFDCAAPVCSGDRQRGFASRSALTATAFTGLDDHEESKKWGHRRKLARYASPRSR